MLDPNPLVASGNGVQEANPFFKNFTAVLLVMHF